MSQRSLCPSCGIPLDPRGVCPNKCVEVTVSPFEFEKKHKRDVLIAYLRMKTDDGDWHAVSDAANDLRVLDGK